MGTAPGTPLLSLELRHLGGAMAPGEMSGGAVSGIDAAFAMFAVGMTPTPEAVTAVESAVIGVQHVMGPWTTGGAYLNFAERPKSGKALFGSFDTFQHLREVKAAYDPADLIRSNHLVRPAER